MPDLTATLNYPKGTCALVLKRSPAELGRYEVHNHPVTIKGEYEAHFALNGVPIAGSPAKFEVVAAQPSGRHTYLIAPTEPAVVKMPYELSVQAVDRYGNHLTTGGSKVEVKVTGDGTAPCTVVDHKDGTYSLHFTVNNTGAYQVEVRIDGHKVKGNPPKGNGGHDDAGGGDKNPNRRARAPNNRRGTSSFQSGAERAFSPPPKGAMPTEPTQATVLEVGDAEAAGLPVMASAEEGRPRAGRRNSSTGTNVNRPPPAGTDPEAPASPGAQEP